MDTIRRLTDQINVFVRFFESINCLFYQLRWLEENITQSNNGLLLMVFGIIGFCGFILIGGESFLVDIFKSLGLSPEFGKVVYKFLPLLIIVGIIGLYLRRRQLLQSQSINQNQRDGIIYNAVSVVEDGAGQTNRRVPEAIGVPYPSAPLGYPNFGNPKHNRAYRF